VSVQIVEPVTSNLKGQHCGLVKVHVAACKANEATAVSSVKQCSDLRSVSSTLFILRPAAGLLEGRWMMLSIVTHHWKDAHLSLECCLIKLGQVVQSSLQIVSNLVHLVNVIL